MKPEFRRLPGTGSDFQFTYSIGWVIAIGVFLLALVGLAIFWFVSRR